MTTIHDNGQLSPDALQILAAIIPDVGALIRTPIHGTPGAPRLRGLPAMYEIHPRYGEIDLVLAHMPPFARNLVGTSALRYWSTLVHAALHATHAYWLASTYPGTAVAAPVGSLAWEQNAKPLIDGWVDAVIAKHLAHNPTLWQPLRLGPFFDRRLTAEIGRLQRYTQRASQKSPCYGRAHGRLRKLYLGSRHVIQLSGRDLAQGLGVNLADRAETEQLMLAIDSWGAGTRVADRRGSMMFFTLGELIALRAMLGHGKTRPATSEPGCLV